MCSRFGLRKVSFPHALEGMPMGKLELLRLGKSAVLQSVGPQQKHPILCLRGKFSFSLSPFLSFLCHRSRRFFETLLNKSYWKWLQSFHTASLVLSPQRFLNSLFWISQNTCLPSKISWLKCLIYVMEYLPWSQRRFQHSLQKMILFLPVWFGG